MKFVEKMISIVIPVYQGKSYLTDCIESIINQTYKNIEILLIDDGSDDGSDELCKVYSQKYDNIIYIYQINSGVSAARNRGIDYAKGEYILFVDCDDYIDLNYLKEAFSIFETEKIDMYLCGYQNIRKGGKIKEKKYYPSIPELKLHYKDLNSVVPRLFNSTTLHAIGTKIYKRDVIEKFQIRFNEKWRYYEDIYFCLEYLTKCDSIYVQNKIMYYYRKDVCNSLSKQQTNIKYDSIHKTYYLLFQLFDFCQDNLHISRVYETYLSQINCCIKSKLIYEKYYTINIYRLYRALSKDFIYHKAIDYLYKKNIEYFFVEKKCFFGAYLVHKYLLHY